MSIYEDFYNTMKDWIVSDYHTPKIKAEVIIDMLISEYVADIVNDPVLPGEGKPVLLAKEFPINGYKGVRNSPAVDYLVKRGDVLYLVELKTDRSSFSHDQLDRMKKASKSGIEGLMDRYIEVLAAGRDNDKQQKYWYQMDEMRRNLKSNGQDSGVGELPADKKDENDPVYKRLREKMQDISRIEILYIVLTKDCIAKDKSDTDKIYVRALDEYRPRDNKEQWELISDILKACTDREA